MRESERSRGVDSREREGPAPIVIESRRAKKSRRTRREREESKEEDEMRV